MNGRRITDTGGEDVFPELCCAVGRPEFPTLVFFALYSFYSVKIITIILHRGQGSLGLWAPLPLKILKKPLVSRPVETVVLNEKSILSLTVRLIGKGSCAGIVSTSRLYC